VAIPGAAFIIAPIALGAVGLAKVIADGVNQYRSMELKKSRDAADQDAEDRLRRLENAVDAIAIEVERIGEQQRFGAAKAQQAHLPRTERQNTPH
jgi:hypothetical protein